MADKTFRITWEPREGAQSYRVFENSNGVAGFSPISDPLDTSTLSYDHRVALYLRVNASYLVETCYATGCVNSEAEFVTGTLADAVGYIKASNAEGGSLSPGQNEPPSVVGGDRFGVSISLSADGNTLAVDASGEDGSATGVNGDQVISGTFNSSATGAVYVFTRNSGDWAQQAYLKVSNTDLASFAQFGGAIGISADGNTLAIGARGEAGFSNGINGDQYAVLPQPNFGQPNGAIYIGAAYVFTRSVNDWQQVAYVKATNNTADVDNIGISFGEALSLSGDGQTLVVGSGECSSPVNWVEPRLRVLAHCGWDGIVNRI